VNEKAVTESGARRDKLWFAILGGIVLLAVLLRAWAALRLPLDYDEPVYLQAGFDYARALREGDLGGVIDYAENREHPALVKFLYSLVVLALGPETDWQIALYAGRLLSALFGVLAVLALALFDPVAGGLLAVHTMAVKYTSQVYLEALPQLASLAAVLALVRSSGARDRWFWLSALALGATAASKFTYVPIVLVLLYLAIWEKRTRWTDLALYLGVAVLAFWLLNPTLWRDPIGRLADTLFFHVRYSQGSRIQLAALPWYQPLYWISRSPPSLWHPDAFFYFALDGVIFLLALPGLYWEWHERRWVVVWIATGLLFLLLWPTKWPQYTLILTPALCLSASAAARRIYHWIHERETYWLWLRQMIPVPPLSFFILGTLMVVAVVVFFTASTLQLTLGRLGWSHFTTQDSMLPSNIVYDVAPGPDPPEGSRRGMILGTEQGAVLWTPRVTTDVPDDWLVFTAENSDLPADRVLSVVRDGEGVLWFGTEAGLARYDPRDGEGEWQVYTADELGLTGDRVYALAVGSDGRLWAGTSHGAAVWDGEAWTSFTSATSGLADDWVSALAIEPQPEGDRIWFGTEAGPSRLDTATGEWTSYAGEFDASVVALLVDSEGRVWAGTLGEGLGVWDGEMWRVFVTGNSGLPYNSVTALAEVEPGRLWIGTALPAEVGGVLAELDVAAGLAGSEDAWKLYTRTDSGYSEAEPMVIAQDGEGRWWIGTRTAGVDIHRSRQ
jgi:hypothetical protein